MLKIEIANPMQVVIVIAEPRTCAGALTDTNAENCGESADTINPQKIIKVKKAIGDSDHIQGESKQQTPDETKATCATFLLPSRKDNFPPTKQPAAPAAIMINAKNVCVRESE